MDAAPGPGRKLSVKKRSALNGVSVDVHRSSAISSLGEAMQELTSP